MNPTNQTPAGGDPNVRLADKVIETASSENARHAGYGALLVFFAFWTTPWVVLKRSVQNLAEWGKARALPSAQSELPVLTYLTITGRPFAHLLWLVVSIIVSLWQLLGGGQQRYYGYSFSQAFLGFLACLAAGYFGQYVVGLWCESMSIAIRIANDIQQLAARFAPKGRTTDSALPKQTPSPTSQNKTT
jgi:hypothetical protein